MTFCHAGIPYTFTHLDLGISLELTLHCTVFNELCPAGIGYAIYFSETNTTEENKMNETDTTERRILLAELAKIQNRPEHEHHDIMTIVGFMKSNREIRDHIARNS